MLYIKSLTQGPEHINTLVSGGRRVVIFVWSLLQQVVIDLLCSQHCSRCWDAAEQARSLLSSEVGSGTVQTQKDLSGPQLARATACTD